MYHGENRGTPDHQALAEIRATDSELIARGEQFSLYVVTLVVKRVLRHPTGHPGDPLCVVVVSSAGTRTFGFTGQGCSNYCSFAYSALASFRMGISVQAARHGACQSRA